METPQVETEVNVERSYLLYGGVGALHDDVFASKMPRETLVEGPSRTGKSLGIALTLCAVNEMFPGTKGLLIRKTLKSMRTTVLETLETEALPSGHPALRAHNRHSQTPYYEFDNGSIIVASGCNGPDDWVRIMGSQWDWIWANEATELTLNDWETLLTRLSRFRLPLGNFAIADCNPDAPTHWLNQRANSGQMRRIVQTLDQNPFFVDQATGKYTAEGEKYLVVLDGLSGVRKERLRHGRWVASEGMIWTNFDAGRHLVSATVHVFTSPAKMVRGTITVHNDERFPDPVEIKRYMAAVDWGFRDPLAMQLWAVDHDSRLWLVEEVYMTHVDLNERAEIAARWQEKYGVDSFWCDAAEPASIDMFNRRMCRTGTDPIARAAEKDFRVSADIVNQWFADDAIFLIRGALQAVDQLLDADKKPTCLLDEIPGYVYRRGVDGRYVKEEPDPNAASHGCDALRYLAISLDRTDYAPYPAEVAYDPASIASALGHDKMDAMV